jgi:hypothetical protein
VIVIERITEAWDRQECPHCRLKDKCRSVMGLFDDVFDHVCDRCDIRWDSDKPIEVTE